MSMISKISFGLKAVIKTLRLALPKLGVGWMFALLTINLNRVAIVELKVTAIIITTMLALHYFLSPFQVISGRIADRYPLFGYRRTPYLLFGALASSLVFIALPTILINMGQRELWAYVAGFIAFIIYGIGIAFVGDSHHALIAEVTEPRSRGAVISVVWTFTIISTIFSAIVFIQVMPYYTPEAMQRLYNLTPLVVLGFTLLGIVGMEKRLTGEALKVAIARACGGSGW